MTAHSPPAPTWIDEMRELLKLGLEHDPDTTRMIVEFASSGRFHRTLDQQIESLPANCRGRVRRIDRDARRIGATDERICRLVILTHNRVHEELLVQQHQASH